ncbi:tat-binding like 7 [Acrodontium crateriforme]|uniref:Tat-binding like 7 n=1 Tax=Acrodontium crateriforme TaxID=150365 RepID=A0AAQ3R4R8_9PEZI|nr:tat-binding like 7 [Acrodontium crateriforme]
MAGRHKRKALDAFDPTKSDSDDLDYGAEPSSPPKSSRKSKKSKNTSRKPTKRRRNSYGDDSDIDLDSVDDSEEASFSDASAEEQAVERNPRTGRAVRKTAKLAKTYEESEEDSIQDSDDELLHAPSRPKRDSAASQPESLVVSLKIPVEMSSEGRYTIRSRRGSRVKREPTPQAAGTRRSSRILHDDSEPLVALSDSGKHETITRPGTETPEPPSGKRPSRGAKGLKKPPSAIMEASQEDSYNEYAIEEDALVSQLQNAAQGADTQADADAPGEEEHDIQMEMVDENERIVQESMEENDDDEEPISRGNRSLRTRRKHSTPPTSQPLRNSRRTLRARKADAEHSDFEPDVDAEDDGDDNMFSDDGNGKSRNGPSSNDESQGRRSGRLSRKAASQRSRSARAPSEDELLDPDEIADEAAELDEDNRRNKRSRKRTSARDEGISYEPVLRNRTKKPDYRIFRPELMLPVEDDDAPAPAITPQRRRGGGGGGAYRSLFSTFGPFGGAGGLPPVFGGADGTAAAGGVESDSSDDEMGMRGGQHGMGGTVGMTPTSAFAKPFLPPTQPSEPLQGAGGGPPGLGKVKDRKALADADPLGVDPNVSFDGVGGLDDHIDRLKEMVALPLLYPEVFQRFHVTPPRGVLFHGPPGTGKTLLARALASSVSSQGKKVTFYMRKGADALSKWVGEAEKQLRLLFEEARKNQPSIIFFDEIDGLAPVRSSKQEQIHASIVATLLALMDGMDGRGQVIVIGATNRPDSVDPALRRPGRFDREFYFPLPEQKARRAIIDIHTKGWEPPLHNDFKNQLAEITRGYGGADLRALCTEAALNAVQGTYPQIYSSNEKLIIDPSTIKVMAKDFMISVNKIVPSSERSAASGAAPLKKDVEPLLRRPLQEISNIVDKAIPRKRNVTALEEALYDDREDEHGFERETLARHFESARIFRPRLLIKGFTGMGQQYLGAALLSKFEGLHVQSFDMPTLMKDSSRSPEAAIVQLFEEVKRHKPSVIYVPNVDVWYNTLGESAINTFTGLLKSIPPTDPVLLLGVMDREPVSHHATDNKMLRDLFGYSLKNQYTLVRPDQPARKEYFNAITDLVRKAPSHFPEQANRKKRKLAQLAVAPLVEGPKGPSKAELKAQKKKDRQTLNMLKLHIQPVMDMIKLKYRKFRAPLIDEAVIAYLYDEQNPEMLSTDLTEEQRQQQQQLFRPYELEKDDKGVAGLREVASGRFYYNLEIVTIEKRLSNGYYKRPKDFLADIKRLAKDAKMSQDPERTLKANELLANVEVDMTHLEQQQPMLAAECEAVYEREQTRERERLQKETEAKRKGESVPVIIPNVPPLDASKTTTENSGPVVLGQEVPGPPSLFPMTPNRLTGPGTISNLWSTSNGTHLSHETNGHHANEDTEMLDNLPSERNQHTHGEWPRTTSPEQDNTQGQRSQKSAHTQLAHGSQLEQYQNSASTTTSGQKTSDKSNRSSGPYSLGTQVSNGIRPGDHPDFSVIGPIEGSQLPDTQENPPYASSQSQASPSSQQMGPPAPPRHNSSSVSAPISAILNDPIEGVADSSPPSPTLILPQESEIGILNKMLVDKTSGMSVEQLEQVNAALMSVIWSERGQWNRVKVLHAIVGAFNETVQDIEQCQAMLDPSQTQV